MQSLKIFPLTGNIYNYAKIARQRLADWSRVVLSFLRLCLEFITANPIFAVALPERRRNLARDVAPGVVVRPE